MIKYNLLEIYNIYMKGGYVMSTNHIIYSNKFSTDLERFREVAENKGLEENDLRVFMFLCCRAGSTHPTKVDKEQMAQSLNLSEKMIKKSLKRLCNYGIISKYGDEHIKNGYMMTYTGDNEFATL